MDRVRKLLSPGTKKKTVPQNSNKTFGVPLEELVRQAPDGLKIPLIVKKICEHIENHGKSFRCISVSLNKEMNQ